MQSWIILPLVLMLFLSVCNIEERKKSVIHESSSKSQSVRYS